MREIKFRAWLKKEKEMYEVCEITPTKYGVLICDSGPFLFLHGECILEQYTGLKDKNGKEIFEGDRLFHHHEGTEGLVSFMNYGFYSDCAGWGDRPICEEDEEQLEIIGNIYD